MTPSTPAQYTSQNSLAVSDAVAVPPLSWSHHLAFPAGMLALYCLLAFYRIDRQSLWIDEVRSLESAAPFESVWSPDLWFRGQGPLYFILLHFWAKVSTSEAYLRSLSVVIGAGGIILVYALGLRFYNRTVAQVATFLLATSPFFIWYSQEVRYVMLMMVTALFATYALQQCLSTNLIRWWRIYSLSLVVAWSAGIANILLLLAHGSAVLCSHSRQSRLLPRWLWYQLPLVVIMLWWANRGAVTTLDGDLLLLANALTAGSNTLAIPNERVFSGTTRDVLFTALPYTFYTFSTGFSVGPTLRDLHLSPSLATITAHTPVILSAALIFGGVFARGLLNVLRTSQVRQILVPWLVVPTLGALVLSLATGMDYNVRYSAMAFPAYCLILAVGIAGGRQSRLRTIALAAVFGFNAYALGNYYWNAHYARDDARAAAQHLATVSQPGDVILLVGNDITLRYYYDGAVPLTTWYGTTATTASTVAHNICGVHAEHASVWLVTTRGWETDPNQFVRRALDQLYHKQTHTHFTGVDIISYQRPPAESETWGCVSRLTKKLS